MAEQTHPAVLWEATEDAHVQCQLCNFRCRIAPDQLGRCQVRRNIDGQLYSLNYHAVCATNVDPIEKKPLYHFQPGRRSFSLAAVGCNFRCDFCQNWQISQSPRLQKQVRGQSHDPTALVQAALDHQCSSIAYTYTEPTVFMELAADCAVRARAQGLANVFVSNGYLTTQAIDFARPWLDAVNVDLKSFNQDFYHRLGGPSLQPVLDSLRHFAHHTEVWLEITTLLIPTVNDSDDELKQIASFIAQELGPHVPWHISRFHPDFQSDHLQPTQPQALLNAHQIGTEAGLHHIYIGNLPGLGHENTYCSQCNQLLIERSGYRLTAFNLLNARCTNCNHPLPGRHLDPITL